MSWFDYDPPIPSTHLSDVRYRARKAHQCSSCNRGVQPGTVYHRETWVVDGEFTVVKTCAECEAELHAYV